MRYGPRVTMRGLDCALVQLQMYTAEKDVITSKAMYCTYSSSTRDWQRNTSLTRRRYVDPALAAHWRETENELVVLSVRCLAVRVCAII